jgi:hypothetical protein
MAIVCENLKADSIRSWSVFGGQITKPETQVGKRPAFKEYRKYFELDLFVIDTGLKILLQKSGEVWKPLALVITVSPRAAETEMHIASV